VAVLSLVNVPLLQENTVPLSLRQGVECNVNSNLQQLLGSVPTEHASSSFTQHLLSEYGCSSNHSGLWLPGNQTHARRVDEGELKPLKEHFKVVL